MIPDLHEVYDLGAVLGTGGFGVVHRARHRRSGQPAAVKLAQIPGDPGIRARILREVELIRGISCPHLVSFLGVYQDRRGHLALAYELVEGVDLDQVRAHGYPGREQILDWVRALAEGVDALHGAGVLHRDLKPENAMIQEDGRLRLLDFGLARWEAPGGTLTETGVVVGTPRYMAGEVFTGALPDRSQDLYALAAVAYWLLQGQAPFQTEDPIQLLDLQKRGPPPLSAPPWAGRPALDAVFSRGLSPSPGARFSSGRDLLGALVGALGEGGVPGQAGGMAETVRLEEAPGRGRDTSRAVVSGARSEGGTGGGAASRFSRLGGAISEKVSRSLAWGRGLPRSVRLGLVLAGLLVGSLWIPPPPEEAPDPDPDPVEEPLPSHPWGQLGEDFPGRLRSELTDRAGIREPDTGLLLVDEDPLRWGAVVAEWPRLLRFYRWLERGGRPWELPEEQIRELRLTDRWFRDQGLPEPFGPRVRPPPPLGELSSWPEELRDHLELVPGEGFPLGAPGPWARRSLVLLAAVLGGIEEKVVELSRERPGFLSSTFYAPLVLRGTWSRQALSSLGDNLYKAGGSEDARRIRREYRAWLGPVLEDLGLFWIALGRSLEEEPGTRDLLASVVTELSRLLSVLLYDSWGSTPPSWCLGRLPATPAGQLVQGVVWKLQRQHDTLPADFGDPEEDWLRGALEGGGEGVWADRRRELARVHLLEILQEWGRGEALEEVVETLPEVFPSVNRDQVRPLLLVASTGVVDRGEASRLSLPTLLWLRDELARQIPVYGSEGTRRHLRERVLAGLDLRLEALGGRPGGR